MPDPFREQRLRPDAVRRVLRRAADLAERDPATAGTERAMTHEEIQRAAGELGLPASAVTEALAHDEPEDRDEARPARKKHSAFLGAPTRIIAETEIQGEPSESDLEDIVDDIRDVIGETGTIDKVGKTMVWRIERLYRQNQRDFAVRVRTRRGRTRIVVEERLTPAALGLFLGLGLGGGIGPMGGYIAAFVKLGAVALVIPLVWIPLMLLLARTIFMAIAHRRERAAHKLMRKLERRASAWATEGGARIEGAAPEKTRIEGTDDDAAAEEEATEAEVAPPRGRARRA
jgi:hypothetical protein